jgi:hypothetical protein
VHLAVSVLKLTGSALGIFIFVTFVQAFVVENGFLVSGFFPL